MLVRELMTTSPVTVRASTTVEAALALLDEHDVTAMPVVTSAGQICGVVSEADLIRDTIGPDGRLRMFPQQRSSMVRPRRVRDVMSRHPVTVRPETDVATAVELATSTAIKSLPVVDADNQVVGILSRRDVVRVLARSDDLIEGEVDALLVKMGNNDWLVDVQSGVVRISGPVGPRECSLAAALAGTVPGVVEVRTDSPVSEREVR